MTSVHPNGGRAASSKTRWPAWRSKKRAKLPNFFQGRFYLLISELKGFNVNFEL
jgi:hypothetical protein